MGARFRRDSDEEWCGATIFPDEASKAYGGYCCTRRAGHSGDHVAMMCDAAKADGVCHDCREAIGQPHKPDCQARKDD